MLKKILYCLQNIFKKPQEKLKITQFEGLENLMKRPAVHVSYCNYISSQLIKPYMSAIFTKKMPFSTPNKFQVAFSSSKESWSEADSFLLFFWLFQTRRNNDSFKMKQIFFSSILEHPEPPH